MKLKPPDHCSRNVRITITRSTKKALGVRKSKPAFQHLVLYHYDYSQWVQKLQQWGKMEKEKKEDKKDQTFPTGGLMSTGTASMTLPMGKASTAAAKASPPAATTCPMEVWRPVRWSRIGCSRMTCSMLTDVGIWMALWISKVLGSRMCACSRAEGSMKVTVVPSGRASPSWRLATCAM